MGALYPWFVISLSAFFLIYKYILQVFPSIMTTELMQAFHLHGLGLGNLAATFFYAYLVTQLFVGVLLDKYSTRVLTTLALLLSALGAYWFSIAHTLYQAELSRICMGCGAAFATVSYIKVAGAWFRANQFAFVSGLLASAAMMGAVFGQAPLSLLVEHYSWRSTLELVAIVGVVAATAFAICVPDRHPAQIEPMVPPRVQWQEIKEVLKNTQNWLLTFYSGLAFAPIAVFAGLWGIPFLQEADHVSRTAAALLASSSFIGLAIGAPLLGWISDRIGQPKPMMLASSGLAFLSLLFVLYDPSRNLHLVHLFLFLFGFGTGGFMLSFSLAKRINSIFLVATVTAMINTGEAILGAVTEPLVGHLLDLRWNGVVKAGVPYFSFQAYQEALILLPFYLFVALILVFFIRFE